MASISPGTERLEGDELRAAAAAAVAQAAARGEAGAYAALVNAAHGQFRELCGAFALSTAPEVRRVGLDWRPYGAFKAPGELNCIENVDIPAFAQLHLPPSLLQHISYPFFFFESYTGPPAVGMAQGRRRALGVAAKGRRAVRTRGRGGEGNALWGLNGDCMYMNMFFQFHYRFLFV